VRFASALAEESPFTPREVLAGRDAQTLARELLAMTPEQFSAAVKNSPMKRAKLRGLMRNAAVVLGNVGTVDDTDVLTRAVDDDDALVREHAAWALETFESERRAQERDA
jgi:epoxyqueuosine reductase